MSGSSPRGRSAVTVAELDAVMSAARVLAGVIAESAAEVEERVSPAQLRILVLVSDRPRANLTDVATALGVHPSNATRACDRLVHAGLLTRSDSQSDRRRLSLRLTPGGEQLVTSVMAHRRVALGQVLRKMSKDQRAALTPAMQAFAIAAGEIADDGLWPPAG